MKTAYIVALVLALTATQANANAVASMPNKAQGEIILTDVSADTCGENGLIVYSTSPNGPTIYGCWYTDGHMIHATFNNGRTYNSYLVTSFVPLAGTSNP